MEDKKTKSAAACVSILLMVVISGYILNLFGLGAGQPISLLFNLSPHKTTIQEIASDKNAIVTKKWVDVQARVDRDSLWEYCYGVRYGKGSPTYYRYVYMIVRQGNTKMIVRKMYAQETCDKGFKKGYIKDYEDKIHERMQIKGMLRTKLLTDMPPSYGNLMKLSPQTIFIEADKKPNYAGTILFYLLAFFSVSLYRLRKKYGSADLISVTFNVANPKMERVEGDTVEYTAGYTAKKPFVLKLLRVSLTATDASKKSEKVLYTRSNRHVEETSLSPGSSNQIQGSFKLPYDADFYARGVRWEIIFFWEIEGFLDVQKTVIFKVKHKPTNIWGKVKKEKTP